MIQGPVGSGKTTALVAWHQALLPLGFDIAWLTLTADDNEVTRFLDHLLASLALVDEAIAREAVLLAGRGKDSETIERIVIALVRGIAEHRQELVLVLDDLHHLGDPSISHALHLLLDYAPATLHLAISSRNPIPLSLARLRSQDQTLELDMRDLRFSATESEQFLRLQLGSVEVREAQRLHELCDGWIAGLQLLAMDLKQRRSEGLVSGRSVLNSSGFSEYFEREVVSRLLPLDVEKLVLLTACKRFCAPLAAALFGMEDPAAALAEAVALITRLEGASLFVVPFASAEREPWYRLNPLLREALQGRFSALTASARRRVHAVAADWFEAQGLIDEAVLHRLQSGQVAIAAELVERCAHELFLRGEVRILAGLLRRLPAQEIEARISLRFWMARVQLYAHEFDACRESIENLRAVIPEQDAVSRFQLALLDGGLAVQRDDTDAALSLLPLLQAIPQGTETWMGYGRNTILSWIYMYRGEYEQARRMQLETPPPLVGGVQLFGTTFGILGGRCLIGLSHALEGQMQLAERVYQDVLYEAGTRGNSCIEAACLAAGLLSEVHYELNEPEIACELLEPRLDILESVSIPDTVLRVMLVLSRAHELGGRQLESLAYIERLEDYAQRFSLDRLLAYSLFLQIRWRVKACDFAAADSLLKRLAVIEQQHAGALDGTHAEIAVAAQRARIDVMLAHGHLEAAAVHLRSLIVMCVARGRRRRVAHLQLQLAVVERRCGRADAARALARDALKLGHRLGLIRTMLDAHPDALALAAEATENDASDQVLTFYVERLQASARRATMPIERVTSESNPLGSADVLSERETDVLYLLMQAMPNKKIARSLGLSPETIKWHLKNVYGKLGVTGRDEAVAKARDLGLVSMTPAQPR